MSDSDEFTAHDRCDRCCAQAQVRTTHGLLFCAHHAREYGFAQPLTCPAAEL